MYSVQMQADPQNPCPWVHDEREKQKAGAMRSCFLFFSQSLFRILCVRGRARPWGRCPQTSAKGARPPLDSHLFGVIGSRILIPASLILPACGADTTTLKVSGVFCYAHTLCGAGSIPHAGRSFFLYEKSVLRESDSLRGRGKEVCTDLTPPLFRP